MNRAFLRIGDDSVPVLSERLSNPNPIICARALSFLFLFTNKVNPFIAEKLISGNTSDNIKAEALLLLGGIKHISSIDILIKYLDNNNRYIRRNAAFSLGELNDYHAIKPLTALLNNDNEDEVKTTAACSLVKIGASNHELTEYITKHGNRQLIRICLKYGSIPAKEAARQWMKTNKISESDLFERIISK
jgi:HEAT repeat protein